MSYRLKLTLALVLAAIIPLMALSLVIRGDMKNRMSEQFDDRINRTISNIDRNLDGIGATISTRLDAIGSSLMADNDFRIGLRGSSGATKQYIVDYASQAMELSGLSTLYILNDQDLVLSSGHFRNEYDRVDDSLPSALEALDNRAALIEVRTPDSLILSLSKVHFLTIGNETLSLVGGIIIDGRLVESLEGNSEAKIIFADVASGTDRTDDDVVSRTFSIARIPLDRSARSESPIEVSYPLEGLAEMQRSIDRWLLIVAGIAILLTALLASWMAGIFSRPVADLTDKTRGVSLNSLNTNFHSSRSDEIGELSRTLGKMTSRLRKNRRDVIEAERRAVVGDMARQVNHDILNGLTPIRSIFQHLTDSAESSSDELLSAFIDRKETLGSSIEYLRDLALNYSRLSQDTPWETVNITELLNNLVDDASVSGFKNIKLETALNPIFVSAPQIAVRRIFENLIGNAIDASAPDNKEIGLQIRTHKPADSVIVSIIDQGSGIDETIADKIFDDFFTTKDHGTGLGLSVVRRLVMDLRGSVRVESNEHDGATFIVTLPRTANPRDAKQES